MSERRRNERAVVQSFMMQQRSLWALAVLLTACFEPSEESPSGGSTSSATTTSGSDSTTTADSTTDSTTASTGSTTTSETSNPTSSPSEGSESSSGSTGAETGERCGEPPLPQCSLPDLRITLVGAADGVQGLQLTYVVRNDGSEASGPYQLDFWDSRTGGFDNPPSVGDSGALTLTDQRSIPAGGREQATVTLRRPANGVQVAFAVIDSPNAIAELDENDNVSIGSAWTNAGSTEHASFAAQLETPVTIPDDGSVASVEVGVSVTSANPELFFSINVTHPDVSELDVRVVAPNGATRPLLMGPPSGANLRSTTLRDGAIMIGMGNAPFAGEFAFAGDWSEPPDIDGMWTVELTDGSGGNVGELGGFSVHVLAD